MARRTLQQGIIDGILSTGHLAQLTCLSVACVQQMCDKKLIDCVLLPGSKERRIPVNDRLEIYLLAAGCPFSPSLTTAKENYRRRFMNPTDAILSPECVDREMGRTTNQPLDPVLEASKEPI